MPPIRLKMQITLHSQSALKHFIIKFYMSLGVSTDLSAKFTKICWKFQCVGVKNRFGANYFKILHELEFKFMHGAFPLTKYL